jgi:hypothetical protein
MTRGVIATETCTSPLRSTIGIHDVQSAEVWSAALFGARLGPFWTIIHVPPAAKSSDSRRAVSQGICAWTNAA